MSRYILSITAQDRSGIVAGVSEAIVHCSGNIEAASQTVHQGYFAMILLCDFPGEADPEALSADVRRIAGDDLHVYITAYRPPKPTNQPSRSFVLTSIGPDRPGILHTLARYMASRQINIDDMYCCITDNQFVVICQVSIPTGLDVHMLQADLEAAGKNLGITIAIQDENIFTAINELSFGRVK